MLRTKSAANLVLVFALLGSLLWPLVTAGDENAGAEHNRRAVVDGIYFPPPGHGMENHDRRSPDEVAMDPSVIRRINEFVKENPYSRPRGKPRWALWRHGRLIHVEGDFHKTVDVASLRKTWHAMIVGAAIKLKKIPSHHQRVSEWLPGLSGNDALATWRHLITQSASLDYPYGNYRDFKPGEMWTYSDLNLVQLCNALAKVFGKEDYRDRYEDVASQAYFDAVGMRGWSTLIKVDSAFGQADGVRFVISLEHMGRLGLLALCRGSWKGVELVPKWFVEELETKQTYGMLANYNGPNDGIIQLDPVRFQESPYGYLTWVNTDGDFFPGADSRWAWGSGAGGTKVLWNRGNGIVFAGAGIQFSPQRESIPRIIEESITGANPLAQTDRPERVGQWDRFEGSVTNSRRYKNPFTDTTLNVIYTRPDGTTVRFWGFHDGGAIWRFRFMPDQVGSWKYRARFSDSDKVLEGEFACVPSSVPGMICQDELNPIWFGYKGGEHALIRSLHVGDRFFAENWPAEKRRAFLDWAQAQGYNMLSVASHYLNRDSAGRGRGWQTPDLWPLNPHEFRKLELMLDDLAARRIIVYPFAGMFGQRADFPTKTDQEELYIKYALARLGPYWNIMLNVAGPEPLVKSRDFYGAMNKDDINRIGRKIHRWDVFGHLLSIHHNNKNGDAPFINEAWLSYGTLQGWKNVDWPTINKALLDIRHGKKPIFAQEVFWPGNVHNANYTDDQIRKKAFVMIMSATAINYADMKGNSSTGFSGSMALSDRVQSRHDILKLVWDFFEDVPFYRMAPRQDLVDNGFCLAEEGVDYLIYLVDGGTVSVDVKPGNYRVQWISARETADQRNVETTKTGQMLQAPEKGDWLLRLRIVK